VRRKLEILIARGWVQRDSRRLLTATDKANHDLFALTESTRRYWRELQASFGSAVVD
jgi:hypothetical protein